MVLEMVGNPTAWQLFRSPFWKFYDTKILYACSCGYWHICFLVVLVLSFNPKWWSYRPVAPHPTIIFFIWLLSMQPWSWVFILPNCPGFMWQYCLHVMRSFSCRSCCFLSCGHYPAGKWKRSSSLLLPHLLPFLASVHSPDDFSDDHRCQLLKSENGTDLEVLIKAHLLCLVDVLSGMGMLWRKIVAQSMQKSRGWIQQNAKKRAVQPLLCFSSCLHD